MLGILLTQELSKAGHEITVIDRNASAFARLPRVRGSDHRRAWVRPRGPREAGIEEADAYLAVSSGDNSNIVSARVARERYHVPRVIAPIYDPMSAGIYERLNIPTVSTTRRASSRWSSCSRTPRGGQGDPRRRDLFRMHVEIPQHLVGRPVSSLNIEAKILVAGVDRGGKGSIPVASSTFQEGDYAAVVVQKDALRPSTSCCNPRRALTWGS